ncbi:MAG: outer membrane beta-barrel domain-containing protein [Bdellovibrionales bacterium]|nr:outer membrane beta-barrel domain-containing protein [Bdellovibrionales bacterium]
MRHLLLFLTIFSTSLCLSEFAQAQSSQYQRKQPPKSKENTNKPGSKAEPKSKSDSDKLDISDLEKKYWSPKDTEFSVVQNRTYSKVKRLSASLQYGRVINDGYSDGQDLGLSLNYFPKERYGYEFRYVNSDLSNNDVVTAFINDVANSSGILPDHGKVKSYWSLGFNWVPIYAKVSLLDKKIVYFDMSITPKIGQVTYEQQVRASSGGPQVKSAPAIGFDITQYFFVHKNFAIRADLQNFWFQQEVLNYSSGAFLRNSMTNHSSFLIGITYYH